MSHGSLFDVYFTRIQFSEPWNAGLITKWSLNQYPAGRLASPCPGADFTAPSPSLAGRWIYGCVTPGQTSTSQDKVFSK